jgi:acyl-coenzyme A thioesterase PaaI-like protein
MAESHTGSDGHLPSLSVDEHVDDSEGTIAQWTTHLAGQGLAEVGQRLPAHSEDCLGCGPTNSAGLHLDVVRTETGIKAVHRFRDAHVGAPGIVHGGAVALAFDDLFGFALYTVGSLAVTRSLTVDYLAPFLLYRPYTFHAQVSRREGRRLLLHGVAWDDTGRKAGSAEATFVVVSPEHFAVES